MKDRTISQRIQKNWYWGLLVLPLLLLIGLLIHFSINVPFWDQWELVTLFQKSMNHTLGFADFFAQHNEHRILFPRLIMFSLAKLTHWNILYEVATNVVLAGLTYLLLFKLLQDTFKSQLLRVVSALAVSLIIFSPIQWENWLWGWQIQWFLNILTVVGAVWALSSWRQSSPMKRLLLAAVMAGVSTYSLASGMFAWVVCLPILFFDKTLRSRIPLWCGLAAVVVGSHYIHYVNPAYHPSKTLFLHEPRQFIHYLVVYIARPVTFDFLYSLSFFIGLVIATSAASLYIYKKKKTELTTTLLPWLCLAWYGMFAAVTTDISRLGFGVKQAYSSRYITLSNFMLIATLIMAFKAFEFAKKRTGIDSFMRIVATLTVSVSMGFVVLNYGIGVYQMKNQNDHLVLGRTCAHQATSADDDCLLYLYPNKEKVWQRLIFLRSIHYGGL